MGDGFFQTRHLDQRVSDLHNDLDRQINELRSDVNHRFDDLKQ
jgi:hypothetical protein